MKATDRHGEPITLERIYADAIRLGRYDVAADMAVAMYQAAKREAPHAD